MENFEEYLKNRESRNTAETRLGISRHQLSPLRLANGIAIKKIIKKERR